MKTVEKVVNPRRRAGEQSPGKIYSEKLKVRRRREWRGVKDTFYDYTRWLYLMSVLGRFIIVPRNIKGFFRYRWMMSYLFVPHGMDKFTIGLRDEALRIAHTSFNFVIADVTNAIASCFRGDRRVGNDKAWSDACVLTDENSMVTFMMGFDTNKVHTTLREVPTMFASNIFHQFNVMHYLDVAQQYGIPGDVCPMPEAEAGISIDDDFCVLGCCAVQNNTTCDGSLMGNGIIAKRLERQYGIPTFQLATPLRHKEPDVMDYAAGIWSNNGFGDRGWLAIALVIFTVWRTDLGILGAIVFGGLMIIHNYIPGLGVADQELFKMMPYLVTIIVLIFVSAREKRESQPPQSLGLSYFREER